VYSVYTDNAKRKLRLFAIDASTGLEVWNYKPSEDGYNQTITSPILDESGNIYFAGNFNLYSVSPSKVLRWDTTAAPLSPSGFGLKMPAIAKENGIEYVYISGTVSNNAGDRYIWKLKASDGSEIWKKNPETVNALANPVSVSAAGTIYTGGYLLLGTSGLFAVNPSNGSKIWSNNVGDSLASNVPNFDADGNIFLGTEDIGNIGAFHKMNASTTLWSFTPDTNPSAVQYPAVIDGQGRVYVGAKNKFVYALNSNDGTVIWKYQLTDEPRGFAIGNGRVYVVGYDGKVYSFGQ
jgi:outer membrane protein assembly factor BamB